jgi:hypothetical protein
MAIFIQEGAMWEYYLEMKKPLTKRRIWALIPLRSIAAGESDR